MKDVKRELRERMLSTLQSYLNGRGLRILLNGKLICYIKTLLAKLTIPTAQGLADQLIAIASQLLTLHLLALLNFMDKKIIDS